MSEVRLAASAFRQICTLLVIPLVAHTGCARWGFDGPTGVDAGPTDLQTEARLDGLALSDAGSSADAGKDGPADGPVDSPGPAGDVALDQVALLPDTTGPTPDNPVVILDTGSPDALVALDLPWPADAAKPDTLPTSDLPWPADAAMPDTALIVPDLPWPADAGAAADAPPPPTGVLWAQGFGSANDSEGGYAVAADGSGNLYLTGSFAGSVDFGCGTPLTSAGGPDVFLASYTPAGVCRWARRFGGTSSEYGRAVTADAGGHVTITGSFSSPTVDFGGGPLSNAGTIYADIFAASFDSASGSFRWAMATGDKTMWQDEGHGIAADPAGNVTVLAVFSGTADFGCGSLKTGGSSLEMAIASLDSNGACRWAKQFGVTSNATSGEAIASDTSGNIYVTGLFYSSLSLGGGQLVSAGSTDGFVASYDSAGTYRWAQRFGGSTDDQGNGVAVDSSGHVFVTGDFQATASFGSTQLASAGGYDVFLASYDAASGAYRWAQRFGGSATDMGQAVATDGSGNVVVTGRFTGTADFLGTPLSSAGLVDIFVVSTTSNGALRWAKGLGGIGLDAGNGVAVTSSAVVITGEFTGPVDFGASLLPGAGLKDIFVAALQP